MKRHLNTLYVTTDGASVGREGRSFVVRVRDEVRLRVPVHNLDGIVCLGRIGVSPAAFRLASENGTALSFLTGHGRFVGKFSGPQRGNVLLRKAQYAAADDPERSAEIARSVVAAKIANCRTALMRSARDRPDASVTDRLAAAADQLSLRLGRLKAPFDINGIRGVEGDATRLYFAAFDAMVVGDGEMFSFERRSRRPPLDRMNALLSFLYGILRHDIESALDAVGLDPAVGFLHRVRPGRPSLALDLMEEFRPVLGDRVALSLVNRQQVRADGFVVLETGAVRLTDESRKVTITAYQKRKQEEIIHPFLGEKTTVGLLFHLQARLLARHLRNELDAYPPFTWR